MRYPILPVGAFVAAFLVLVTAFWHWRARNVPTLSLIFWLFILNVIYGVNSLAWSSDVRDKAPLWCDISAKLIIGASTALPACTLCICRYLAMVGGNKTVGLDRKHRRRIVMFDLAFCLGIPMIFMALHYIVQGHRYNIVQYIGCRPATYISFPCIFIVWLPPLLLSVGTFVYGGIALYHFVQMRVVFSSILEVSSSPMSTSRYMRLIAMSATVMLWTTILASLAIWANTSGGLMPWVSWEHVHMRWNRADAYIWILMSPQSRRLALLSWWAIPVSSVILFLFLAFDEDAAREYRRVWGDISSRVFPRRDEKGMSVVLPLPSSGSSYPKDLPSYSLDSSYITSPKLVYATEGASNLREFILPLPALTRTKTTSKPIAKSVSDSLGSLIPSRPAIRSRAPDSGFYFHPAASHSTSNSSEITRFSMSDDHLAFGQIDGPSTPLSINAPTMNHKFQELPPIQPSRSLHSMMGIAHSKTRPQAPVQSNELGWSGRSGRLQPSLLRLVGSGGRFCDCTSEMTVTVAEPREALMRGSVQVTIQRREPYDQV